MNELYLKWCEKAVEDSDLTAELKAIEKNEDAINDAFYRDLEFGTAGLRGVIGAGTNRMNIYTVRLASYGLASYVNSKTDSGSVAIAYDSRIKSDLFAKTAAEVFAAAGIKVLIYPELMPTPMLSYAVRHLKCDAGVVVTASHNPAKYNGYKAYGSDGCQLGPDEAKQVYDVMTKTDIFGGIEHINFEDGLKSGIISYIGKETVEDYLSDTLKSRVCPDEDLSGLKVIYTPLHGTGNKPVREILDKIGVKQVTVVPEQELPNGNFPTCPYPNPEIRQAFECALALAEDIKPDLLLATDPDCDRVGIAIPSGGGYRLMTGNEVGALLLNFVLDRRKENGTLPAHPLTVKTIVSTELCARIAEEYGCELVNVLTGFKYIGEQIGILEEKGEESRYVFGFEESYGYLAGTAVRDKDAVVASMLICEMTAFYKAHGASLTDVLEQLYRRYGYYRNVQKSFTCEGQSGMKKIADTMERLRSESISELDGSAVIKVNDYQTSVSRSMPDGKETRITLPRSNVLSYFTADGSSLIVRPSGTEPKIKLYIGAVGETAESAEKKSAALEESGIKLLGF